VKVEDGMVYMYIFNCLKNKCKVQGILHTESDTQLNHEKAGSTKQQDKKKQDSRE
jgi:hypothetical protein